MQVHRVIVGFECRSSLPAKDSAETVPHRAHRAATGLLHAALKERKHDDYADDDDFFEDDHDNLTASSSFSGSPPPTPSSCASSDPIPIPYKRLGYPYWAIVRGVVPPRHSAVSTLQVQTTCGPQVQRCPHATTHSSKQQQQ